MWRNLYPSQTHPAKITNSTVSEKARRGFATQLLAVGHGTRAVIAYTALFNLVSFWKRSSGILVANSMALHDAKPLAINQIFGNKTILSARRRSLKTTSHGKLLRDGSRQYGRKNIFM